MEALSQELEQLQGEIATQRSRVRYAEATRKRYLELSRQGYVSANTEQERADAVLEQQGRLQSLERGRTSLERELLSLRSEWEALPIRERSQLSELERAVTETAQDGIENRARTEVVVVAPKPGRVSGLTAEIGQPASLERPLLSLVPDGSALEAHLFAPSRDIGFVKPGQAVMMRFSAFPYQKFGHQRGVITEVSRTPLGSTELAYPVAAKSEAPLFGATTSQGALSAEPVFRIKVRLERQSVMAQGQDHALQPGMQLDADVLLDRRTLFEWVFETAYSLRGKYAL
jgi:membrane fusion protein